MSIWSYQHKVAAVVVVIVNMLCIKVILVTFTF